MVEFESSFYKEIFADKHTLMKDKDLYRFRLCAFIDLKESEKISVTFRQNFTCRYVSVMFTDRTLRDGEEPGSA